MAGATITPAEWAELNQLLAEHRAATLHGAEVLRLYGMESREFAEADAATGALYVRIRKLQGLEGVGWQA